MMQKIIVPYEWDPELTDLADLAVVEAKLTPIDTDWTPALRDTIDGKRVLWARFEPRGGKVTVWLRDRHGVRPLHMTSF